MSIPATLLLLPPPPSLADKLRAVAEDDAPVDPRGKDRPAAEQALTAADSEKKSSAQSGKKVGQAALPCAGKSPSADVAKTPVPPTAAPVEPCRFSQVKVECPSRKMPYSLVITPDTPDSERVLGIIAGDSKAAIVNLTVAGLTTCVNRAGHKGKVLDLATLATESQITLPQSDSQASVECLAHKVSILSMEALQPSKHIIRSLRFSANTCDSKSRDILINVYPDIKSSLSLSLAYNRTQKHEKGEKIPQMLDVKESLSEVVKPDVTFSLKGEITKNGVKYGAEGEIKKIVDRIKELSGVSEKVFSTLAELGKGGAAATLSVSIKYPAVSFDYKSGWEELKNSPLCDYYYLANLGLTPLVGIDVKWDILGAFLLGTPPLGTILSSTKTLLEKTKKLKIFAGIKVSGTINGNIQIEKRSGEKESAGLKGEGKIAVDILVEVEGGLDFFFAEIGGGAKAGGKSEFSIAPQLIQYTGGGAKIFVRLIWSGVVLYRYAYGKFGLKKTVDKDLPEGAVKPDKDDNTGTKWGRGDEIGADKLLGLTWMKKVDWDSPSFDF